MANNEEIAQVQDIKSSVDGVHVVGTEEVDNDTFVKLLPLAKTLSLPKSGAVSVSTTYARNQGVIPHPYSDSDIAQYENLDSTFKECISIKADTIAGIGIHFASENIDSKKEFKKFIKMPNNSISTSFLKILRMLEKDYQSRKNAFMEVVKSGNKVAMYRLPAYTMFVLPKFEGGKAILGEAAGYKQIIRSGAINPTSFLPFPATGDLKDGVHYVVHFRNETDYSDYYGYPTALPHLADLVRQNYLADQFNINFFSNNAQPSYAILVTGGKLSKKGQEKIKKFINSDLKGVENSHKMLYMSVDNEKANIQIVPISKTLDEQFRNMKLDNRNQIALYMRVLPKLLGISSGGNFGGGSAGIADLKTYLEVTDKPRKKEICGILDNVFERVFGFDPETELDSMDISSEKDDSVCANMYFNMEDECGNRVLDVNDVRKKYLKMKPIELKTELMPRLEAKTTVTANGSGDARTSDNTETGTGDGSATDLNSEKNNQSKV